MAKLNSLKKGKGTPPPISQAPGNTQKDTKDTSDQAKEATKPLQFKLKESMYNAFSQEAMEMFGYERGAKVKMFTYLWEQHVERNK